MKGMTSSEVAEKSGVTISEADAVIADLVKKGVVVDSGLRRKSTQTGQLEIAWIAIKAPPAMPPACDLDFDFGGVLEPGWFNCTITFQTLADAKAAEPEFRGAGYVVELLDEIDEYSNAAWLTVSKFADGVELYGLFEQVLLLADQLNGDADTHWIEK